MHSDLSIGGQYRTNCRAIQHFLVCQAIISSLRKRFTIQDEVVRWVRAPYLLMTELLFEPHQRSGSLLLFFFFLPSPFPFFFNGPPNLSHIINCIPFGLGNTGEYSVLSFCIVPPCCRANTATLELNIP